MLFFTASDGARIHYRDQGSGTPLLLLHGLMAHGAFFPGQAELADCFRLISVDLRGHGASREAGDRPTVEQLAADVAELVAWLDLQDAIGVGWSLGATVLWHVLAGAETRRFVGAVVVDMTPRVRNGPNWKLGLSPDLCEARSAAIRDDFEAFAAGAGQAMFADTSRDGIHELADWASFEFARNDPAAIGAIWASLERQDMRALLSRIEQPTMVVHGALSPLYGQETASHLVAALPNAFAVRFDRSGHAPHLEEPALFNTHIRNFADRLLAWPVNLA